MIIPVEAYAAIHAKRSRVPLYRVKMYPKRLMPVAYWAMDEVSGTRFDSAGDNDLTDNNTVGSSTSSKQGGRSALFSAASSEYFDCAVPAWSPLQVGNIDFLIAGWVFLLTTGADCVVASQWLDVVGKQSWKLWYNDGAGCMTFTIADTQGNTDSVDSVTPVTSGNWVHVMAWRDTALDAGLGASAILIAVNAGLTSAQYTRVVPSRITEHFRIGGKRNSGGVVDTFWNGLIDEVAFFRAVLTSTERNELYNGALGTSYADWVRARTFSFSTLLPQSREPIGTQLLQPVSLSKKVEIENSRAPLSEFTFLLHDKNSQITSLLTREVAGYTCELHAGFFELTSASFIRLFTGTLTEFRYLMGRYEFVARSALIAALDKTIFSGASTRLTANVNTSATTFNVENADGFSFRHDGKGRFIIDDEICTFTGFTSTSFTGVSRTGYIIPPATVGGIAHTAGAVIRELVCLGSLTANNEGASLDDLHPIEHLKSVLQESGKEGVGTANIPLDLDALDIIKAALGADLQFLYLFADPITAKAFIEALCLDLAAYPYEDELGRFSIKLFQARTDATIVDTIQDKHLTRFAEWTRNAERALNKVIYHYDHNPITDQYETTTEFVEPTLVAAYGREIVLEIFSKGIRSEYVNGADNWCSATAAFLIDAATRHIARFGTRANVLQCKTILNRNLLETGDDVEATFTQVINLTDGTRSVTDEPMEITKMNIDFEDDTVDCELLGYPE